jgi:hypothetical protein
MRIAQRLSHREGDALDRRRRTELQIRAVLITYRGERRKQSSDVMERFRERANTLLAALDPLVDGDPELEQQLENARRELDGREPSEGGPG